jgi:gluconokinase
MGLIASGLQARHPAFDEREPRRIQPRLERRDQYDAAFARYLDHYSQTRPGAEAAR